MSNETKWTPAPWQRLPGKKIEIGASGVFVCTVRDCHPTREEAVANARLIAAAPDLYEALAEVLAHTPEPHAGDARAILARARAALAKARGES